ncbi:MAG: hypothetical protein ACOCYU_06775 [Brevefilum sp.]
MAEKQKGTKKEDQDERKTIFAKLFSKPSKDEEYVSDLKAQWAELDAAGRVKFAIGVLIGVILFFGALALAYLALSALVG